MRWAHRNSSEVAPVNALSHTLALLGISLAIPGQITVMVINVSVWCSSISRWNPSMFSESVLMERARCSSAARAFTHSCNELLDRSFVVDTLNYFSLMFQCDILQSPEAIPACSVSLFWWSERDVAQWQECSLMVQCFFVFVFYLTKHSTHFIYGYMASDIWLRTILIVRKETFCDHICYSFWLTARVLL